LPWLLTSCLSAGSLAVPVTAQPGSQDLFLRVSGGVVGFALKAVAASNGTQWADVRDELSKAPTLPTGESYVLVLWSLNLATEMRTALRDQAFGNFGPGQWVLGSDGRLALHANHGSSSATAAKGRSAAAKGNPTGSAADGNPYGTDSAVKFTVLDGMQLVITNPHVHSGGGLADLLGLDLLRQLQAAPPALADVDALTAWMAKEVTSLPTAAGGAQAAAANAAAADAAAAAPASAAVQR